MKDGIVSEEIKRPVLDEQMLAKLLEAAYVLQEQNRELQQLELGFDSKSEKIPPQAQATPSSDQAAAAVAPPPVDYTSTLAQIVETQHKIQVRQLDFQNALSLIAQRAAEIGHASGAAIGILKNDVVQYKAVAGRGTLAAGSEVPLENAACVSCIRTAEVFPCKDIDPEVLLDSEECRRRGIRSLIAVPVFHCGAAVGGLELYYSQPRAFTEQDIHTCQLMAGLVTEALAREEEVSWKKTLADDRAAMIKALETLKPNLTALVERSNGDAASPAYACKKCGHTLVAEEQFCGNCGTPRSHDGMKPAAAEEVKSSFSHKGEEEAGDPPLKSRAFETNHPGAELLSPGMSLDEMVESLKEPSIPVGAAMQVHAMDDLPDLPPELLQVDVPDNEQVGEEEQPSQEKAAREEPSETQEVALAKPDWSSASSARDYLERLAGAGPGAGFARFWNSRRGDIYLAIALILVAVVIRWGIWSNHPVSATNPAKAASVPGHKTSPEADLSFFDRMLISVGLAEAPEQPKDDGGNPSSQVWVDLHTALYYCQGADLYGKTARGKYTTQREAQLDQFQPAYRKPCN